MRRIGAWFHSAKESPNDVSLEFGPLTDKCIILTRRDTTYYAYPPGQVLRITFDRPIT